MLSRVLEPEVMDCPEEARDYDAMDHGEVNRRFVADFRAAGPVEGEILDLGTGTAQIPVELARQDDRARVVAADLSPNMLTLARYNVDRAGLSQRIVLDLVDAKGLPYDDGRFAAVVSNSIVHHVGRPRDVVVEAVRVLAQGGLIFFRDLLRPADDAAVKHLVTTYAGDDNKHQRQMFEDSLRAALTVDEFRGVVQSVGFDPLTVDATSDRHWTWRARKDV